MVLNILAIHKLAFKLPNTLIGDNKSLIHNLYSFFGTFFQNS